MNVFSKPVKAIRKIRGYRTITGESANLVAGLLPWDLEATAFYRVYEWRVEVQRRGVSPLPREVEARREELRRDLRAV